MRRIVFAVVTMIGAVLGAALLSASPAQAQVRTGPARPAAVRADNNATVCANAKRTVQEGSQAIVADLRKAAQQMRGGDQAGADATVKATGPKFSNLGTQLVDLSKTATDGRLRSAVNGLGLEFNRVGQSVTDVNSLRKLDQSGLQTRGRQVAEICGFSTANPSGSGGSRGPSA